MTDKMGAYLGKCRRTSVLSARLGQWRLQLFTHLCEEGSYWVKAEEIDNRCVSISRTVRVVLHSQPTRASQELSTARCIFPSGYVSSGAGAVFSCSVSRWWPRGPVQLLAQLPGGKHTLSLVNRPVPGREHLLSAQGSLASVTVARNFKGPLAGEQSLGTAGMTVAQGCSLCFAKPTSPFCLLTF